MQIGLTSISPGDIVFGDLDGVVIIPRNIERDVVRTAMERVAREELVRTALDRDNMSATDAAARYGVL